MPWASNKTFKYEIYKHQHLTTTKAAIFNLKMKTLQKLNWLWPIIAPQQSSVHNMHFYIVKTYCKTDNQIEKELPH